MSKVQTIWWLELDDIYWFIASLDRLETQENYKKQKELHDICFISIKESGQLKSSPPPSVCRLSGARPVWIVIKDEDDLEKAFCDMVEADI